MDLNAPFLDGWLAVDLLARLGVAAVLVVIAAPMSGRMLTIPAFREAKPFPQTKRKGK